MFFFKPKRREDTGVVNLPYDPSGINPFISQVNKVEQLSTNTGSKQYFDRCPACGCNEFFQRDSLPAIRSCRKCSNKDKPYRNHFVAGPGHADEHTLNSLVSKGLMVKRPDPFDEVNGNFVYHVTDEGKAAIG